MSAIAMPPRRLLRSRKPVAYRWTIREYRELDRTNLFHDVKTMLIHGELYVLPFPGPPHDVALSLTDRFLHAECPSNHYVRNQQSLDIGIDSDPGPDLAIVPGDVGDYSTAKPTIAAFVVEVADESLSLDTTTKAELYATAGVPEYWVIDLEHRQVLVFRDPHPLPQGLGATAYKTHLTFSETDRVSLLAAPQAAVLVSDLLPR